MNDNINHAAGDEALQYYAALLGSHVGSMGSEGIKGVVYRTGGDELSVAWQKTSAELTLSSFRQCVESAAEKLALEEHVVTGDKDGGTVEAPTFLRIGVGATHHAADEAETAVRSEVYMKAFGSLSARGQMVSRFDPRLEGVPMWKAAWGSDSGETAVA